MSASKIIFVLVLLCVVCTQFCFAQNKIDEYSIILTKAQRDSVIDYVVVEEKPKFPGDDLGFMLFIYNEIDYANTCLSDSTGGRVFVQFIISSDGVVRNEEVIRGVREDLDKEALRISKKMPVWKPGKQNGKPVPVRFIMAVRFQSHNMLRSHKFDADTCIVSDTTAKFKILLDDDRKEFYTVEPMSKFIGEELSFSQYLSDSLRTVSHIEEGDLNRNYYLKFIVSEKGTLESVEFVKMDYRNPKEIKIKWICPFYSLPNWEPVILEGKQVSCVYVVPLDVKFYR